MAVLQSDECATAFISSRDGRLKQSRKVRRVGRKCRRPFADSFRRLGEFLVLLASHRLSDPVGPSSSGHGEADLSHGLRDFGNDVVRAVFISDDGNDADFSVGPSFSSTNASMGSRTRFAMLDGWPSQMGVPITRMSAASRRLRCSGQ
jgi:hypothetical protein